mmetsp:Transcript_9084/g.32676  ORF Transcript_9084/g.32676 Transcript_9084/m.32676 type:complete len:246 (-) Transcript_9084:492-1229(-)
MPGPRYQAAPAPPRGTPPSWRSAPRRETLRQSLRPRLRLLRRRPWLWQRPPSPTSRAPSASGCPRSRPQSTRTPRACRESSARPPRLRHSQPPSLPSFANRIAPARTLPLSRGPRRGARATACSAAPAWRTRARRTPAASAGRSACGSFSTCAAQSRWHSSLRCRTRPCGWPRPSPPPWWFGSETSASSCPRGRGRRRRARPARCPADAWTALARPSSAGGTRRCVGVRGGTGPAVPRACGRWPR